MKRKLCMALLAAGLFCGCSSTDSKSLSDAKTDSQQLEEQGNTDVQETESQESASDFTLIKPVEAAAIENGMPVPSRDGYFFTTTTEGTLYLLDSDANPANYPAYDKAWFFPDGEGFWNVILIQEDENGNMVNLPISYAQDGVEPEITGGIGGFDPMEYCCNPDTGQVFQRMLHDEDPSWTPAQPVQDMRYMALSSNDDPDSQFNVFDGTYYIWDMEEDQIYGPYTKAQGIFQALPAAAKIFTFTHNYFTFNGLFAKKTNEVYTVGNDQYPYAESAGFDLVLAGESADSYSKVYFDEDAWAYLPEHCTMISSVNKNHYLLEVDGTWYLASLDQIHTGK